LDDPEGLIVANAAVVPAGTPSGGISVFNAGPATTDVVVDMNGYFAAPTDLNDNTALGVGTLSNNTTGGDEHCRRLRRTTGQYQRDRKHRKRF
jgi:hypothetical protein